MGWLGGLLRGGGGELGWDDLVRLVVRAIGALARRADRGRVAFPPEVTVRIEVAEGSVEVIRGFVARRELDEAVGAALANEHDCDVRDLPLREYTVASGSKTRVDAIEGTAQIWELAIEGGDLDGRVVRLSGRRDVRFGRGPWHGPDRLVPNDVVVCEETELVSRRAGKIAHAGSELEVEALDQGDALVVRRASGETIRPARTAAGRVSARAGDVIELIDGKGGVVKLHLRRSSVEPA